MHVDPRYKSLIEQALIGRMYGLRAGERAATKHPGSKSYRSRMSTKQRRRNQHLRAASVLRARVVSAHPEILEDET